MCACHFCKECGTVFLHPIDFFNDMTFTEMTNFKSHIQPTILDCWCAVCCFVGVTLVAYIQNMVCKLNDMQIINWRTFCKFSSSFANISHSANLFQILSVVSSVMYMLLQTTYFDCTVIS